MASGDKLPSLKQLAEQLQYFCRYIKKVVEQSLLMTMFALHALALGFLLKAIQIKDFGININDFNALMEPSLLLTVLNF